MPQLRCTSACIPLILPLLAAFCLRVVWLACRHLGSTTTPMQYARTVRVQLQRENCSTLLYPMLCPARPWLGCCV